MRQRQTDRHTHTCQYHARHLARSTMLLTDHSPFHHGRRHHRAPAALNHTTRATYTAMTFSSCNLACLPPCQAISAPSTTSCGPCRSRCRVGSFATVRASLRIVRRTASCRSPFLRVGGVEKSLQFLQSCVWVCARARQADERREGRAAAAAHGQQNEGEKRPRVRACARS